MADPWGVAAVEDAPTKPDPWGVAAVEDTAPAPLRGAIGTGNNVPVPAGLQGSSDASQEAEAERAVKARVLGAHPLDDSLLVAGQHLKNNVVGLANTVVQPPQNTGERVAQVLGGPGGLPLYRSLVEPSIQPAEDAVQDVKEGWMGDAARDALSAIPVVGPPARQFADTYEEKGLLPAAAGAGVDYLTGKALHAGAGAIGEFANNRAVIPGQNYTPLQHASFSGVLARGSGVGKGFFPKDVATDIGSSVRQAAADNPGIHEAIMTGSPEDSVAGTQALLQKVRERIDAAHAQALAPVEHTPINPKPIQDAVTFPASLANFAPEDAAAIADLKGRLGNIRTLGGLNDLRKYLNTELSSQFKLNKVAAGNSGAVTAAMQDALKATRELYYDKLQQATGQDFQGLKRQESSVLAAEEGLGNSAPAMAARQAIAEQPLSARAQIGEALQGAHTVSGSPIAGGARLVAQKVLGETPMTPIQEGIQHFFKDLPPASTPAGATGPVTVARPGPGQAQPRLQPPGLPQLNAPAGPAGAPVSPQGAQMIVRPVVGPNVQLPQAPIGLEAGTSEGNWGTPPALTAGQQARAALPAQAGPETVIPNRVPPPLNEATARTNVWAGKPKPQPENAPVGKVIVSPEGTARIEPKALPPPETHAWSRSAWSKQHPNGSVKAAETLAKKRGYKVVD